jgi:hydrogenase small subunit
MAHHEFAPRQSKTENITAHIIWMTTGLSCEGDSVALTSATNPSLEDIIRGIIPGMPKVVVHNSVVAFENGAEFIQAWWDAEAGKLDPFVLVVEGSIPNERIKQEGYWAAIGVNPKNGQPITTNEWVDRLAPKAAAVVALGTCATYGGIPAMKNNPTGAMGVCDYLGWGWTSAAGLPVVNIPGCPAQPDNTTESLTVLVMALAGITLVPELDDQHRLTMHFGRTVHEGCNRAAFYEHGNFATEYGSDHRCLVKLGCKGPVVKCNVPIRGWQSGVGGCPNVGGICMACTMPGFPDKFMPFMDEARNAKASTALAKFTYGPVLRYFRNRTIARVGDKEPAWRHPRAELTAGYSPTWGGSIGSRDRSSTSSGASSTGSSEPGETSRHSRDSESRPPIVRSPEPRAESARRPAEAEPSPGAPTAVEPKQRYLRGRCPDQIRLGDIIPVEVRVDIRGGPRSVALYPFDVPPQGAELTVVIHCPGYRLHSPLRKPIHVPADGPSPWALFELEATIEGVHEIALSAYRDGTGVGELTLQVNVEQRVKTGPTTIKEQAIGSVEGVPGEVTLMITYDSQSEAYRFMLFDSEQPEEEVTTMPLLRTPRQVVEGLVGELDALAGDQGAMGARETQRWLKEVGVGLWGYFLPDKLQAEFWQRQDRIGSLTIISSRDSVPWELLYPLAPGKDCGFLAEQFPVVRWISGMRRPRSLSLRHPALVLPDGGPPFAATEAASVGTRLGAAPETAIRTLDRLLDLLDGGGFGALHFACHNTFRADQSDASWIDMSGQRMMPGLLNSAAITRPLAATTPLVFMNACSTARSGALYTELLGWASAFLKAGAGAFVGAQWAVRDATAPLFADAFYDSFLTRRQSLGQALQDARKEVRDRPGDPSWLAYTLYGNPRAMAA